MQMKKCVSECITWVRGRQNELFQFDPSSLMETIQTVFLSPLACYPHLSYLLFSNPLFTWDVLKGRERSKKWSRGGKLGLIEWGRCTGTIRRINGKITEKVSVHNHQNEPIQVNVMFKRVCAVTLYLDRWRDEIIKQQISCFVLRRKERVALHACS